MKAEDVMTLRDLLQEADLLSYEEALRSKLKLRNATDFKFVTATDLDAIEMSRPEQRRLQKTFTQLFPSSIVGRLKKKLRGVDASIDKAGGAFDRVSPMDQNQHVIPNQRITCCKKLGEGEFGTVFQGFWNNKNENRLPVAIKVVTEEKLIANPTCFLQEASIMHRVHHENIVHLYGVVLEPRSFMLVSELAPLSSLLECLRAHALRSSFSVDVLCLFGEQIAKGMAYLEESRLIHRDLAARNVLVFSADRVKISDFGLSRSLGIGEDYYRAVFSSQLKLPIAWCAPECITHLRFTTASDCWAFGVTLWEMFSYGLQPWLGLTGAQILNAIDLPRCERLPRPEACPMDFYELMLTCWGHEASDRPDFSSLANIRLPDIQPQSLTAIACCNDLQTDHLQYSQHDLIIVLDKAPKEYPDGYYWRGVLKNGRIGLFRPSQTVAYLGSDLPTNGSSIAPTVSFSETPKKKGNTNKRPVISEPQGDFRHTCHVGSDGSSFGLLSLDKKHLAIQPNSAEPQGDFRHTCHVGSDGSSLDKKHPICHVGSDGSNFGLLNLDKKHLAIQPNSAQISPGSSCSVKLPSAPPLSLKKPRAPSPITLPISMQQPPLPPKTKPNNVRISPVPVNNNSDTLFLDLPAQNGRLSRHPLDLPDQTDSTVLSDLALDEVFNALDQELTNFSLTTIEDFSDRRPLINSNNHPLPARVENMSMVRPMSEAEMQKWMDKSEKAHRNVDKHLDKQIERIFGKFEGVFNKSVGVFGKSDDVHSNRGVNSFTKRIFNHQNNNNNGGEAMSKSFSDSLPSRSMALDEQWNEEAQAAYKLLVQCGLRSEPVEQQQQQQPVPITRSNSDQPNKRQPPPVPPKPIRSRTSEKDARLPPPYTERCSTDSTRKSSFAPAVASSALFASKDEIVRL